MSAIVIILICIAVGCIFFIIGYAAGMIYGAKDVTNRIIGVLLERGSTMEQIELFLKNLRDYEVFNSKGKK